MLLKSIALSFFFLLFNLAHAQSDSIKGNQFTLKGKLINELAITPPCGYIAFATAFEFEIIEFSDTSYHLDSIAVIFTCPDFDDDDFFQLGKTYNLKIADENQASFGWTIMNGAVLKKYPLRKKLYVIDKNLQ